MRWSEVGAIFLYIGKDAERYRRLTEGAQDPRPACGGIQTSLILAQWCLLYSFLQTLHFLGFYEMKKPQIHPPTRLGTGQPLTANRTVNHRDL